jgi:mono/diheme cytochrome c family protein
VLCVGLGLTCTASNAAAEAPADGKAVFVAQKCTKCHSAPGIKGGKKDLAGVAKTRSAAWMKKWLLKEETIDGKKHKKGFSGTPAELDAVVKWLSSLT